MGLVKLIARAFGIDRENKFCRQNKQYWGIYLGVMALIIPSLYIFSENNKKEIEYRRLFSKVKAKADLNGDGRLNIFELDGIYHSLYKDFNAPLTKEDLENYLEIQ